MRGINMVVLKAKGAVICGGGGIIGWWDVLVGDDFLFDAVYAANFDDAVFSAP